MRASLFGLSATRPLQGEERFRWNVAALLAAPRVRPPAHLLTGEDPWLRYARHLAAEQGRTHILAGMEWSSDDAKLKHFSAMYATERRCSYVSFNVLNVRWWESRAGVLALPAPPAADRAPHSDAHLHHGQVDGGAPHRRVDGEPVQAPDALAAVRPAMARAPR